MEENNQETNITGGKKFFLFVFELVKIAFIAFIIVAPIRYFLFQPFIVSGESMMPNLQDKNYLIVDEISYRFSNPQRGDIVVFNAGFIPGYTSQRFIKRVIGLPGETINVSNGQVKIIKDGETTVLNEKYLPRPGGYPLKTIGEAVVTLKADQYFVMGDNRSYSYDSRIWGVLAKSDIIGKASLRILPITEISWLK